LKKHRVGGLLEVSYTKEVEKRAVRKYKDRPARTEERIRYVVNVHHKGDAIYLARRMLGWRLYVTNAPKENLDFAEAVKVYRGASHIEHNFARLKGRPLGIRPFYVQREDHAKGMGRLMSLALRVLTLIEYVVRENLQVNNEVLSGLYAGNPKRTTERPTTERLLKAFKGVALTLIELSDQTIRHVTPLSDLQRRILKLLGLSTSIYEDLTLPGDPIPI
jgi:transposase